ncbi:MAG: cytochrome bc complex cytochrome b subunit [Fidelibacterota bacterium]
MADDYTLSKLYRWFDSRYKLKNLIEFARSKTVPVTHESLWYYFGGVTLFLFVVQVLTGIMLLLYYNASSDAAFESIQFIMTKVNFGWLVRSIHSWSANLMILSAFIHMFSVFFMKAYRNPRELTWVTGMVLFFLALAFGFSGYLLPWNELAFFATKVGTDIVGVLPVIGKPLMTLLRGSEDVTGATLSRFFGFHVAVLPGFFTVFLTIHLVFVQIQGMSEPLSWEGKDESKKKTMPFFPNFLLRDLLLWLIVLNILAILAVFFPWELGEKADPFASAPAGIKPEWYFVFMFQTFKFIPPHILFIEGELLGVLVFMVAGILWTLVPFWDRKTAKGQRNRWINYLGILVIIYIIFMTVIGYVT